MYVHSFWRQRTLLARVTLDENTSCCWQEPVADGGWFWHMAVMGGKPIFTLDPERRVTIPASAVALGIRWEE